MSTTDPRPWRCTRCHQRLAWTATTVGCPHCRITADLIVRIEEKERQQ